MAIDVAMLIAGGLNPTAAKAFAVPLAEACARFGIDTKRRIAAFLGQCGHESAGFTALEENLYYTTPERIRAVFPSAITSIVMARAYLRNPQALANRVYANRGGNGDEKSGDGWRYRGRGLIQLSLLDNYAAAQRGTGRPYTSRPDLVALPPDAALTAAWFWSSRGLNALADAWDLDSITRAVNGRAMVGRMDRIARSETVLEALA